MYVPDFIREMKDSISDQSYAGKLELLKEVPVLILDDIGAENLTPWVRDEIFGRHFEPAGEQPFADAVYLELLAGGATGAFVYLKWQPD